jgi:hypothetical protein
MTANHADKFLQFTSSEASHLFERHTGFLFHPTVPGQLMARLRIEKKDPDARPATYDAKHWTVLWGEMMSLAMNRCKHDPALKPPFQTFVNSIHAARGMYPYRLRVESKIVSQAGSISESKSVKVEAKAKSKTKDEPMPHPKRCFIKVPFAEKDEAKALGAKFDLIFRMWYVPMGKDRKLFRWPDELMPRFMRMTEPMDDLTSNPKVMNDAPSRIKEVKGKKSPLHNEGSRASARFAKEMKDRLDYLLDE